MDGKADISAETQLTLDAPKEGYWYFAIGTKGDAPRMLSVTLSQST